MASADTSIFSLQLGDLPLDTFRVVDFQGEEGISRPYSFRIRALAHDKNLSYDDAMDAVAALIVRGPGYEVKHHGVITAFTQVADRDEDDALDFSYEFLLEPRFKSMDYVSQSRIFHNQTAAEIIKAVLKEYYAEGDFWKFKADDSWPKREYTVQYNESDWAFVSRLMEDEGIWYFWDHAGRQECLVMVNKPDQVAPIPNTPEVQLVAESGMVNDLQEYADSISRAVRRVVSKAVMKDFNPATPDVTVVGTHVNPVVPGGHPTGEHYQFGDHLDTPDEAARKARLRSEMLSCAKEIYQGTGIFRSARAGCRVKLTNAAEQGFDGDYLLVKVTHLGDTEADGAAPDRDIQRYRCAYEGVKASIPWRAPLSTPKPRISGLLTALVEGPEDKYAYLDEEGRYHAKFFFDRSDLKDGKASRPIRLAQPYAGPDYGLHMPLHNGTEIALGFYDGDPDRPIALGAVPNPANASPVNSRNKSEAVIRTASGHQIRLDDKEEKTVIEITTRGKHVLSMNDDAEAKEIRFQTTDKNELAMDDKGKNFRLTTPEGAHTLKMDYDKKVFSVDTKYGHKLTLDDAAKRVAVQTMEGHILSLDDDKQLLTLQDGKGKHVFQIDAGGGLISITTAGDMELAAKGKLTLAGKEVAVEATGGALNLKAKQDLAVEGMNVNVGAKQKVAVEAKMDASLAGLNLKMEGKVNVDLKAGVQAKMTGVMTNVESKAINTVKGAIVMVN